jgi:hypothetical protein
MPRIRTARATIMNPSTLAFALRVQLLTWLEAVAEAQVLLQVTVRSSKGSKEAHATDFCRERMYCSMMLFAEPVLDFSVIGAGNIFLELPFFRVKDWLNPGNVAVLRLCTTFRSFLNAVVVHMSAPLPARLFWFNGITRMELTANNYDAFLSASCGGELPAMEMFVFSSADKQSPPGTPTVAGSKVKSQSSGGRPMQEEFRACVMNRDGRLCVLCRATPATLLLEAAHIVPFETCIDQCMRYGLPAVNEVRNGIILCKICHYFFDRYLWYVTAVGKVVVADAVLQDSELTRHWRALNGIRLQQPPATDTLKTSWWPIPQTWAFREEKFLEFQ